VPDCFLASDSSAQNDLSVAVPTAMAAGPTAMQIGGSVRAAVQPIGNCLQQSCLTGLM
jgi:hypothetical protein